MVRKCSKSLIHRNPINHPMITTNGEVGKKSLLMEDIFVQENNYYCAPAIVKSMLQHFGIEKNQGELANELHTSPKTGSEYEDIARVVNQYIFGNSAPSILEDGYPRILAVDLHALYPNLGSANHVVLCVGYRTLPN